MPSPPHHLEQRRFVSGHRFIDAVESLLISPASAAEVRVELQWLKPLLFVAAVGMSKDVP